MANALLSNEELQERVKIYQEPKLKKWLNDNRIAWIPDGNGRPITTLSAIERVLFQEDNEEVAF